MARSRTTFTITLPPSLTFSWVLLILNNGWGGGESRSSIGITWGIIWETFPPFNLPNVLALSVSFFLCPVAFLYRPSHRPLDLTSAQRFSICYLVVVVHWEGLEVVGREIWIAFSIAEYYRIEFSSGYAEIFFVCVCLSVCVFMVTDNQKRRLGWGGGGRSRNVGSNAHGQRAPVKRPVFLVSFPAFKNANRQLSSSSLLSTSANSSNPGHAYLSALPTFLPIFPRRPLSWWMPPWIGNGRVGRKEETDGRRMSSPRVFLPSRSPMKERWEWFQYNAVDWPNANFVWRSDFYWHDTWKMKMMSSLSAYCLASGIRK